MFSRGSRGTGGGKGRAPSGPSPGPTTVVRHVTVKDNRIQGFIRENVLRKLIKMFSSCCISPCYSHTFAIAPTYDRAPQTSKKLITEFGKGLDASLSRTMNYQTRVRLKP